MGEVSDNPTGVRLHLIQASTSCLMKVALIIPQACGISIASNNLSLARDIVLRIPPMWDEVLSENPTGVG